jgi:hypothetical protein
MKPVLTLLAVTLIAAATAVGAGQDDVKPAATSVVVKEPGFGDTDELLHITRRWGQAVLTQNTSYAGLAIDLYQNGKKLPYRVMGTGCEDTASPGEKKTIDFSVQAADLDWLKLDDGPKGHCRVRVKVNLANSIGASIFTDVPKNVFDFSNING